MAAVTIRYTADVAGHPERGSGVTVERTDIVDGLLNAGLAVIVNDEPPQGRRRRKPASDA